MADEVEAIEASNTYDPDGHYLCVWAGKRRWTGSRCIDKCLDLSSKYKTYEHSLGEGSVFILFKPLIKWSED